LFLLQTRLRLVAGDFFARWELALLQVILAAQAQVAAAGPGPHGRRDFLQVVGVEAA
jgi:hypothetical protein